MQLQTHETPPLHIRTAHFSQERVSMLPRPFCGDYRTQFDTQIRAELGAAEAYRYTPLHHKQSISDGVINQHPDPPHWRRPVCLQLKPITSCPGGGVCEACRQNQTDGRETAAISCIFSAYTHRHANRERVGPLNIFIWGPFMSVVIK